MTGGDRRPGRPDRRPDFNNLTTQQTVVIVALVVLMIVACIMCGSKVQFG